MRSIVRPSLAMALVCLSGCYARSGLDAGRVVPELVMQGVRFRVDKAGSDRARGTAEVVTLRRDTGALAVRGLAMTLSGAEGEVVVGAPAVSGQTGERRYQAAGGLTAIRGGDRATTEAAWYDPGGEGVPALLRGAAPVRVTGPGYRLTGTGFTLDPATRELRLGGGARLVSGLPGGR